MSKVENKPHACAEELLANLGAKIDVLIEAAVRAKAALTKSEEMAAIHSQFALKELHEGLENAWSELSQAWKDHDGSKQVQTKSQTDWSEIDQDDFPSTC
ncbi:MAG TPA: hypothetical protein EYN91_05260 [Candidatus Melainabacteria bacterium]|jgi:hypothetical protein|nr:hypothetical protein [Candidatus Melainabacteria bacterium]HIN63106.1 hypothetical protein [Candidatus Obscuribacterales bacterium]